MAADRTSLLLARDRVPRLVLRFAVTTAFGLALAAIAIVTLVRHTYAAQGERQAIERARVTAEVALQAQLHPSDLTGLVSASRRRELNRLFARRVLVHGTLAASLYGAHGAATYSTGRRGSRGAAARSLVSEALTGRVMARINRPENGSGRVLGIYLPLAVGRSKGVLVLTQDYAPIAAATRHSSLLIAGVLEGVLLALCALLMPMLARASSRIGSQLDALDRLATHDELTGLANRRGFRRALDRLAKDPDLTAVVMLVDLDGFHEINDALGPESGDLLLAESANRLLGLGGVDLVARLGEDEFGLLVSGTDDCAAMVQSVEQTFTRPFTIVTQRVAVETRIGCAQLPRHGRESDVLLRRAGIALSVAKETRTRAELYDPDHDASDASRLTLTSELHEALREGQITVHYQPQADLATNAIRGVEALVRWQHPRLGLLAAAEFIPAAERTGLIGDIGRLVLATCARQWREWNDLGVRLDIAVNLSAVDLLDPQLPQEIADLIQRYGLPAEYLVLEITEHTLLRDEPQTRQTLEQLHRIGARLAVDDYGTGYASLAYLRNLRADQVKLDRSFTRGLPGEPADEAIVSSTIELAHKLGATVVAEGIETHEQWRHLAKLGCDIAQGYLIGRPVPAAELLELVRLRPSLRIVA